MRLGPVPHDGQPPAAGARAILGPPGRARAETDGTHALTRGDHAIALFDQVCARGIPLVENLAGGYASVSGRLHVATIRAMADPGLQFLTAGWLADGDGLLYRRRHAHASTMIGTQSIHIDWATGMGGGPGFSYKLVHVYVDGALVDESAHGGSSLGFTLWGGPALAVIRRGLAVGVASDWVRRDSPPTVWLMTPDRGE